MNDVECRMKYFNDNDVCIAEVNSVEAWYAVKRLMGMPKLPERKLDFRVIERLSQWEEIERLADKEMKAAITK